MVMNEERLSRGQLTDSGLAASGGPGAPRRIRVLLVDDHTLFRQGVCALLQSHRDIEVVGEAWNGKEAIAEAIRVKPDVVIMDIAMPIMNGIEATYHICKEVRETRVLVLASTWQP